MIALPVAISRRDTGLLLNRSLALARRCCIYVSILRTNIPFLSIYAFKLRCLCIFATAFKREITDA